MKNNALTYSLKVWLTGLLLGSAATILVLANGQYSGMLSFLAVVILFGSFFSFPSFLLLFLIALYLNRTTLGVIHKKLILSVNGLVLTLLSFILLVNLRYGSLSDFLLAIPYAIVIVTGAWLYKLEPPFEAIEDTPLLEE